MIPTKLSRNPAFPGREPWEAAGPFYTLGYPVEAYWELHRANPGCCGGIEVLASGWSARRFDSREVAMEAAERRNQGQLDALFRSMREVRRRAGPFGPCTTSGSSRGTP